VVLTALQACDLAALLPHEGIGFVTAHTEAWHHEWFGDPDGA
jgi:hypothetical protein